MTDEDDLTPQMAYAIGVAVRQVVEAEVRLPTDPGDGDCLIWAPMITRLLRAAQLPAHDARVIGWADPVAKVIAFVHRATVVDGGVVVDGTARQLNPAFPPLLITVLSNYIAKLAEATRVPAVTVEVEQDGGL